MGAVVLFFFYSANKSHFQAIFFHLEGGGVVLYRLHSSLLFVGFVLSVIFSLGGGLRLIALFDSRPSRFP